MYKFSRVKVLWRLARALDWQKDPNPEHWKTINGAKVHLDKNGNYDGGAGSKFNGRHHYGPDWRQKSALMNRLAAALHGGVNQKNVASQATNGNNGGQGSSNGSKVNMKDFTLSNFPTDYNLPKEKKNNAVAIDLLNKMKSSADPQVYQLYLKLGQLAQNAGAQIKVTHKGDDGYISYRYGTAAKFEIKYPILSKKGLTKNDIRRKMGTWLHQNMHAIDFMCGRPAFNMTGKYRKFVSVDNSELTQAIGAATKKYRDSGQLFSKEALRFIDDYHEARRENTKIWNKKVETFNRFRQRLKKKMAEHPEEANNLLELDDKVRIEMNKWITSARDREYDGDFAYIGNFTDLYDAISGGYVYDTLKLSGHGSKYYSNLEKRNKELLAQWGTLKMVSPKLTAIFRKDYPDVAKALDGVIDELNMH